MKDQIFVTEMFMSVQGEGARVGRRTLFVRLFGCNFKCRGFGMPKGQFSDEYELTAQIHKRVQFKSIDEVPVPVTGCDSFIAWDKRFRDLSKKYTASELVSTLREQAKTNAMKPDIVFTGGEPLMHQDVLFQKIIPNIMDVYDVCTFETNGAYPLNESVFESMVLNHRNNRDRFYFSVSPKLSNSGEPKETRLNPKAIESYHKTGSAVTFKFVVDGTVLHEVIEANRELGNSDYKFDVYVMPSGAGEDEYRRNAKSVAEFALSNCINYSPRLQIDLFKNAWGT